MEAKGLFNYSYAAIGTDEQKSALDLAHIRNNQYRSRARKLEYVAKLEGKIQGLQVTESGSSLLLQLYVHKRVYAEMCKSRYKRS